MNSLTERLVEVIDATNELREIRSKLALIDEERRALEERAERLLANVASAASTSALLPLRAVRPASLTSLGSPAGETFTERVLRLFAERPFEAFSATDICAMPEVRGAATPHTVRGTLSRLVSENRIARVGYGKYGKKREDKENAPPAATSEAS